MPAPGRSRGGNGATVELLKVLLRAVAEAERVAPKVLATIDDLEAIADDDEADVPALRGWRRRLFGEKALALKAGQIALSIERGSVLVTPRSA
jgi:ribonuclease D